MYRTNNEFVSEMVCEDLGSTGTAVTSRQSKSCCPTELLSTVPSPGG